MRRVKPDLIVGRDYHGGFAGSCNYRIVLWKFLKTNAEFEIGRLIQDKLTDGYLRRKP